MLKLQFGHLFNFRHWCESGDNLDRYGWLQHDGRTFGYQEIVDFPFTLETSFVKFPRGTKGGDWTARISVNNNFPNSAEPISLIWYVALDKKTVGTLGASPSLSSALPIVRGETSALGDFVLNFEPVNGTIKHHSYLSTVAPSLRYLRETLSSVIYFAKDKATKEKILVLPGELLRNNQGEVFNANFIAVMITVEAPFTLDIAYRSLSDLKSSGNELPANAPVGDLYTNALKTKRSEFKQRFEKTYQLKEKGYTPNEIQFAEAALSNMVGGIGYFYGSSQVQSEHTAMPVPYWKSPLYTAVPSRSFFPRGFLWDEGFHELLIGTWDVDIGLDIMCHWMDLMNVEGWIPREVILGEEALAKVPDEFVTQRNTNANPPTFFLTLKLIITKYAHLLTTNNRLETLERLYPRLQAWIGWYNTTQNGNVFGTYRWRGRENFKENELNPKTLTSGFDDYPRASHPDDTERHVDLRCWIAFATGVMAELAHLLGRDDSKYLETHFYLSDNALLNELHLSPHTKTYSDYGFHTDSVALKAVRQPTLNHQHPQHPMQKIRVHRTPPEYKFVDSAFGYVSLFPFLMEILTPDSPYLEKILHNIHDPEILWSNYGLRSLSKQSPMYMKRNTDDDPPYWRGQIWININYLALKALHHYATQPGPYSEDAKRIYTELRHNVVRNIINQYKRSGYIWEQYNDTTGEGSGCKPFTGWSALVVLIMAEQY